MKTIDRIQVPIHDFEWNNGRVNEIVKATKELDTNAHIDNRPSGNKFIDSEYSLIFILKFGGRVISKDVV